MGKGGERGRSVDGGGYRSCAGCGYLSNLKNSQE